MPKDKSMAGIHQNDRQQNQNTRTFIIATSLNNEPLSTTAEFSLDPEKKVLYGLHEMGTEKLNHIQNNPKVSLNWHKEFDSFADFRCCQIKGHAELLENTNPEFEAAVKNFLPYEKSVRLPENDNATAEGRRAIRQARDAQKGQFCGQQNLHRPNHHGKCRFHQRRFPRISALGTLIKPYGRSGFRNSLQSTLQEQA